VRKQLYFNILKVVVGAVLIALLIRMAPLGDVVRTLRDVNVYYLLLAIALYLSGLLVSPIRWSRLLAAKGIDVPLANLASYFFIGYFFNNFLPTIVGGDLARARYVGIESNRRSEAFGATIVDRAIGFLALTAIVLVLSLGFSHVVANEGLILVAVATILGLTALASLFFKRSVYAKLNGWIGRIRVLDLGRRLTALYAAIYAYREHKLTCLTAFILSLILQSALIMANYCLGLSVGIRIGMAYYFLFIPIIAFASMIPLTPNALGIREHSYRILFTRIGVSETCAVSLSLLNLFLVLVASLIGGVIFVLKREELKV
jgi:uncharacterized protein (TIRG00374 family)